MDNCQRCNMPEQYGCGCTSQEMNKWRAEKIIALQARVAELEAERDEADDLAKSAFADGASNNIRLAEAAYRIKLLETRAEAAEALLSETVKAVEQEMLRVCNEYSKKGNMAAATAIHDTWLCVQTALAAIQEDRG